MKLHGDPWNNRWSSFYGIAWNVSMEFHTKCHNPPWKMSMQKFPWNSMEIGALMFSMEFHRKCPNPPCKYFPWKSMEKFPWNSMEIDVLILRGIPWRFFTREFMCTVEFLVFTWHHQNSTKKLSLLLSFYFHVILEHLKTFIETNFRFRRVLLLEFPGFCMTRHLDGGRESSYVG